MKPIIVSPPFGTYITSSKVTSVLGSYTLYKRSNRWFKVGQFVLDNLRHPVPGGYRNRIGLRNNGVGSVGGLFGDCIYSLVGLEPYDWEALYYCMREIPHWGKFDKAHVELNVSCPNVVKSSIDRATLERYTRDFIVTVKLPPDKETILPLIDMCGEAGVHSIHLSNTKLSELGGLSGYPLKQINLPLVEDVAKRYCIPIIGGGGIYEWQDLLDYSHAGATYFSISTAWFKPWKARNIILRYYSSEREERN